MAAAAASAPAPVVMASDLLASIAKSPPFQAKSQAELAAATPQLAKEYLFKPVTVPKISNKRKAGDKQTGEEKEEDGTATDRVAKLPSLGDVDLPNGKKGRLVPLRSCAKFKDAKEIDEKGRVTDVTWRQCGLGCIARGEWKLLTPSNFYKAPQNYSGLDQRCTVCKRLNDASKKEKKKKSSNTNTGSKPAPVAEQKKDETTVSQSIVDSSDDAKDEDAEILKIGDLIQLPNGGTGQIIDNGRAKCYDCIELGKGTKWRKCEYQYCLAMGTLAWKILNADNYHRTRNNYKTTCRRCIQKFNRGDLEPDSPGHVGGDKKNPAPSFDDSAPVSVGIPRASAAAQAAAPSRDSSLSLGPVVAPAAGAAAAAPPIGVSSSHTGLVAAIEAQEAKIKERIKQIETEDAAKREVIQAAAERLKKSREELERAEARRAELKTFELKVLKDLGLPIPMDTSS